MTLQEKANKLDELISECKRLSEYRNNLYNVIYNNEIATYEKHKTFNMGRVNKEVYKTLSAIEIRDIKLEIDRIDSIISFINNTINNFSITIKSKI